MATHNEIYIQENTRTSHKRWESIVMYALHYALRDVEIKSQHSVGCYLLDGYIPAINLAIEIDEPHHEREININNDIGRQEYIEAQLKCRFERIKINLESTDHSVYAQLDELINKVKEEITALGIEPWSHKPIPRTKNTLEYTQEKQIALRDADAYEFTKNLKDDIDRAGLVTQISNINALSEGGNGQLGFNVCMDGITFELVITATLNPKVQVVAYTELAKEKLGLELEPKNYGRYYTIESSPARHNNKKSTIDFLLDMDKKLRL
jgi:very-short-patch-repair endonuclease